MSRLIVLVATFGVLLHSGSLCSEEKKQSKSCCAEKQFSKIIYTVNELKEIGKWKDGNLLDMNKDALNGDRAALYMIGMEYLTGLTDLPINVENADLFFAKSASFGFAPSIMQLIHKNIEVENPFLIMVYMNILASSGHEEFIIHYHMFRKEMSEKFGLDLVREVERLASSKKELILKNQEELSITEDKMKFTFLMEVNGQLITSQDKYLSNEYWSKFSKLQKQTELEVRKLKSLILNDGDKAFQKYEISRQNVAKLIELLEKDQDYNDIQLEGLIDSRVGIRAVKRFKKIIDDFSGLEDSNVRELTFEISLLCKYVIEILEIHYDFVLSPEEFLESEEKMKIFIKSTKQIQCQQSVVERFFSDL